jgi:hypothetical protein
MWPFAKDKHYTLKIIPLRPCHCGAMSFGPLRGEDAVHCNVCGAMFLIQFVTNPVAKKELEEE